MEAPLIFHGHTPINQCPPNHKTERIWTAQIICCVTKFKQFLDGKL